MSIPPSSPRLPSPPPPTEIQFGPQSPSLGDPSGNQESAIEQSILDLNSARRIHPGTKAADMAAGPPLVPLAELDSAFQLQEHLKALHHHYTRPSKGTHTSPINRETALIIATPPEGVDKSLWLYELCRFLINKCNDLIVGFLFDLPPCSSVTCPEMRASEWQFLCAVHESPKSCCAIDYCCHTLDWATNIVTSQKIFPSRLSLRGGDGLDDRGAGVKHLINIFRRLHRIFAHAWFQHRGVFWQVEGQTGLYVLFKTVCDNYELLPAENYKLPPEAEGLEPLVENQHAPTILKSEAPSSNGSSSQDGDDPSFMGAGRTNTRRHIRSSPSTGSAVTTVLEAEEDDKEDDEDITQSFQQLNFIEKEVPAAHTEELEKEVANEITHDPEIEADIPIIAEPEDVDVAGADKQLEEAEPAQNLEEITAESPTIPNNDPLVVIAPPDEPNPVVKAAVEEVAEEPEVQSEPVVHKPNVDVDVPVETEEKEEEEKPADIIKAEVHAVDLDEMSPSS